MTPREDLEAELERIEAELAERYGILRNVREILLEMDRAGYLREDEQITAWRRVLRELEL